MQINGQMLQAFLKSNGMTPDQFVCRLIQALIVFHGKTQREVAQEYGVHEVNLSEMLAGNRKWRKGLLPGLLDDLGYYDAFKEIGLI